MRLLNSTEVFALTYRRASSSLDFKVKQIHYELPDFGLYFCRLMRAIDVFAASQGIARSVAAITEGNISQPILNFGRLEVPMYARVWRFGILPGKTDEFDSLVKSIVPAWKRMAGFRGLLVMRTGPGEMLDGTVISTWETMEELRGSENKTFQETVARVLSFWEPHPSMREEQVVVSEYPSQGVSDITAID